MTNSVELDIRDCGVMGYEAALALQQDLCAQRHERQAPNTVLIVEHNPVITLGARRGDNTVLLGEDELTRRGIEIVQVRRGGAATAHNPGQLVFYPILKLKSLGLGVNEYIRLLEDMGIELLRGIGVESDRRKGFPGLWVGPKKIASIGVQVKRWITMHGMAININNDLSIFEAIIPCGLDGVVITSVEQQTSCKADMDKVKSQLADICVKNFTRKAGH